MDFGLSDAETSWIFARIRAYSPNALIVDNSPIRLGSILTGVLTASYGGNGRANLDSRGVVTDGYLPICFFCFTELFYFGAVSTISENGRNFRH